MKKHLAAIAAFARALSGNLSAMTPDNGITAHRGESKNFLQNSLEAFSAANAAGADWIETDVHLTKDGYLVLIHDKTTRAYCSENKVVKDSTYAELCELDMAEKFREKTKRSEKELPKAKIVRLDEALDLILKEKKARLSIQPKCDCVDEVMELVRKKNAVEWVGFNDANAKFMCRAKELEPSVTVFWDRLKKLDLEKDIPFAKKHGFEYLVLFQKTITPENVKKIKDAGFKAGAWTVNDPATMKRFLEMGIDRLYTDDPVTMKQVKAGLEKRRGD